MNRFLLFVLSFIPILGHSQTDEPVSNSAHLNEYRIDSFLLHLEQTNQAMGSLAIIKSGELDYASTIGYRRLSDSIQADASTKYRIGSVSKTYAATMIMQLVEEGKLTLETKLENYFPSIPNADKITIRQLLSHKSGIYNFTDSETYWQTMEQPISRDSLLHLIQGFDSLFEPGTQFRYSNSNYALLAMILEQIDGKHYADILRKRICEPCGLKHTQIGKPIETEKNEAKSYIYGGDWISATNTNMSFTLGAGDITATATDVSNFLNCLFSNQLLSQHSRSQMMEVGGYGLGLINIPFYGKSAFGHNGGIDGFLSMAYYFPEENVAVTYLGNGVRYPINEVLIGILSNYFELDYEFPQFNTALDVPIETLQQYIGEYSSEQIPLKTTVRVENGALSIQLTSQPKFFPDVINEQTFELKAAGAIFIFDIETNSFTLKQLGQEFTFTKE